METYQYENIIRRLEIIAELLARNIEEDKGEQKNAKNTSTRNSAI